MLQQVPQQTSQPNNSNDSSSEKEAKTRTMSDTKITATSKSQLTDVAAESKGVHTATFGVYIAAAVYIVMMLIALPLAVNLTVNVGLDICEGPCLAATSQSQTVYNNVLLTLRGGTFLFGNLLGLLGDKYGRRPVMIFALAGYSTAGLFYFIAWTSRTVAFFFVGAAVLGIASPLNPHGIAYVSDISQPHRSAVNMGKLQGLGYFFGLMTGAALSLAIGAVTTTTDNVALLESEEQLLAGSNQQSASYIVGFVMGLIGVLVFVFRLPESLHKDERTEISWLKANPLGIFVTLYGNAYRVCIWIASMFLWASVGAGEAVTGQWWLRRYAISTPTDFFMYLVAVWILAGIGSVVMTRFYTKRGLKWAVHVSSILTIVTGVATSFAPTVPGSYVAGATSFFSSAAMPCYLALFMGQASPTEKGEYSGVYRTSEALAKFLGITFVGNHFAETIKPFTPDASCVDDNSCLCGIETCPDISKGGILVPKVCSLGPYLSTNFVPLDASSEEAKAECAGPGNFKDGPLKVPVNKLWCVPKNLPALTAKGQGELGCYEGFNAAGLGACLGTPANFLEFATTANLTCNVNNTDVPIFASFGEKVAFFNYTAPTLIPGIKPNATFKMPSQEHCPQEGKAVLDLCWQQPHGNLPGYIMLYVAGLTVLAYIFFCIAELFFVDGDARYWIAEDTDEIALGVLEPEEHEQEAAEEADGNSVEKMEEDLEAAESD